MELLKFMGGGRKETERTGASLLQVGKMLTKKMTQQSNKIVFTALCAIVAYRVPTLAQVLSLFFYRHIFIVPQLFISLFANFFLWTIRFVWAKSMWEEVIGNNISNSMWSLQASPTLCLAAVQIWHWIGFATTSTLVDSA